MKLARDFATDRTPQLWKNEDESWTADQIIFKTVETLRLCLHRDFGTAVQFGTVLSRYGQASHLHDVLEPFCAEPFFSMYGSKFLSL